MNKLITICFLIVLGAASVASATTTHHVWEFGTDNPMPDPDVVELGPGIAPARLQVDPGPGGWLPEGVWSLSGEIDVEIYNDPEPREKKEITIWLTWMPDEDTSIKPEFPVVGVAADPMVRQEVDVFQDPPVGGWILSTYYFTIYPNPEVEYISIKGDILVDRLEIYTECIPEPATMALLGFGGLTLLRIRRKH